MSRPSSVLTEAAAKERRASINPDKGLAYTIFYDLEKGDNYHGLLDVEFFFTGGSGVFFDWTGDSVETLTVNNKLIDENTTKEHFDGQKGVIRIDEGWLQKDSKNKVTIKFHNRYYRDGEGIHTYVDTDGKQYMYTETEPFLQNRVIPCFDQPDIKGTFKRYITCPEDWVVVTTEAAKKESTYLESTTWDDHFVKRVHEAYPSIPGDKKIYDFLDTKPLPTYLNSLFAGAFKRFDLAESKRLDGLPMAIYCRETLKEFVEAQLDDIFEYHKQAVAFYSDFFQFKYPFSKCDAIFCPEYRMGAMEYPGGITYSESIYLYRTKTPSTGEQSNRGRVIYHEMAHMWFGDTVTMKWWDGLWLNESFADFCCFEAWTGCQDKLPFDTYDGKLAFLQRKQWGYREDVMITTHPIQHTVADTLAAQSVFDGITYPKGAACIKQLAAVLGADSFKKAMVEYFKRFAWKNTLLSDLLGVCQEQVKDETHPIFDLNKWNKQHLESAGLNWVKVEWDPSTTGKYVLKVHQGSVLPEHPTLRFHKMDIAFVGADSKIVHVQEAIIFDKEMTEIEYTAEVKASAILLNYNDKAFVRVIYDDASLAFLMKHTADLEVTFDRAQALKYINDGLKDCQIKANDYFDFALDFIRRERYPQVVQFAITELTEIFSLIPSADYPKQVFKILVDKLSNPNEKFEGDMIALLFGSLITLAEDDDSIDVLKKVIEGKSDVHYLKDFKYSLSQNWNIRYLAQMSSRYTAEEKQALISSLEAQDKTDSKKEWMLKAKALTARGDDRKKLLESVMDPKDLSYKEVEHLCTGLTSKLIPEAEREEYFEGFFENFLKMFRSLSASYSKTIRLHLMPRSSKKNDLILQKLNEIVGQTTESEFALKKGLLMVVDTANKRKRLYEFNTSK